MRDLHVVALSEDGRHVVLATTPDAKKGGFRVALDERLTAAVKGELLAPGREQATLSVKEIQARLRAGESVQEIARSAGVPLARVERFAGPVLSEREQVVQAARRAVLVRGRRGPSSLPLGEAVDLRLGELPSMRGDSVVWTAFKRDDGRWTVEVSWFSRGRTRTAQWYYDVAARTVVSADPASAALGHVDDPARPDAEPAAAPSRSAAPRRAKAGGGSATGAAGTSTGTSTGPTGTTGSAAAGSPSARPAARAAGRRAPSGEEQDARPARRAAAAGTSAAGRATPAARRAAASGAAARPAAPARPAASAGAARPASAAARAGAPARPDAARPDAATGRRAAGEPAATARRSGPRTTAAADGLVVPAPGAREAGQEEAPVAGVRRRVAAGRKTGSAGQTPAAPSAGPQPDATPAGQPDQAAPATPQHADVPATAEVVASAEEPPAGPPALRVVPPPGEEERPPREPRRGRAVVPGWADVLLSTAPPQEREE